VFYGLISTRVALKGLRG